MMRTAITALGLGTLAAVATLVGCGGNGPQAEAASTVRQEAQAAAPATYTLDADFDAGASVNVVHEPNHDQLQLDDTTEAFDFIWIAVSSKGTAVKIDTKSGEVLGEYQTSPMGVSSDPSRTTVDKNGNVWVANRNDQVSVDGQLKGSVVHLGLQENNGCVDRNGNGVIDTSTGLGDVRPWSNAGSADTLGGTTTAEDECIIHYTRVNSYGTRHVSVDADNNVWVSGTGYRNFDLLDGATGSIIRSETGVGFGGYGGLIDANGVIWSSNPLLRWDTANPLTGPNGGNWIGYSHPSYGLCIDSQGNVWNTSYGNGQIRKFSPDGTLLGTYSEGNTYAQGCVVDGDDHVWVAHSLNSYPTVGHLLSDGTYVGSVDLGESAGPTGVAVDGSGKIWATGYVSHKAYRIDPAAGPIGSDGVTPVGAVDFTTENLGGYLYNYSDMTGSTLQGAPDTGSWSVVHDSALEGAAWGTLSWTADVPGDGQLVVRVASSTDGVTFGPEEVATNGENLAVEAGRYLRVRVSFTRSSAGESPILYDLSIATLCGNETVDAGEECDDGNAVDGDGCSSMCELENQPPVAVCQDVTVSADASCFGCASPDAGSYDPDGDPLTLTQTPECSYGLGVTLVTLDVSDPYGEADSCSGTVTVVDDAAPVAVCNAPPTITPPDAPISFTATSEDNCGSTVSVSSYDCYAINGAGKRIDKTQSCVVGFAGDTLTISDSGGVGDHIVWTLEAADGSGNVTSTVCEVEVVNPGQTT